MSRHDCDLAVFLQEPASFRHGPRSSGTFCCRQTEKVFSEAQGLLDGPTAASLTTSILQATSRSRTTASRGLLARWITRPRFSLEFSYAMALVFLVLVGWSGTLPSPQLVAQVDAGWSNARVQVQTVGETFRQTLLAGSESVSRGAIFVSTQTTQFWEFLRTTRGRELGDVSNKVAPDATLYALLIEPLADPCAGFEKRIAERI